MNLKLINKKIETFVQDRGWAAHHSIKNLVMALSVETSELLEIFQWLRENNCDELLKDQLGREKVADEIADIFIYLLLISSKCDIDLEQAVLDKIKKNEQKYPTT